MFCTHLGVVPGKGEAPPNLPSSESIPPAQDEGMQQQTILRPLLQHVHYLRCYSLVSSADTSGASSMHALVPVPHIKHPPLEDKLRDAKEYFPNSENGICLSMCMCVCGFVFFVHTVIGEKVICYQLEFGK